MNRYRLAAIMAGTSILGFMPSTLWAQVSGNPERYAWGPHMTWGGGWTGMFFGPVFMIIFLGLLILAAVMLVRWLGLNPPHHVSHHPAQSTKTPLDIVQERFARGEIDKDEYEEKRRILGQ